jgi:hypothetical protein
MKLLLNPLFALSVCLIFFQCKKTGDTTSSENNTDTVTQVNHEAVTITHPCHMFSGEDLEEVFGRIEGEIKQKMRGTPYPSCMYVWQSTRKEEVRTGNIKYEIIPENRVTITIMEGPTDEAAFDKAIEVYPRDMVVVPDIGRRTVWSDEIHQATVQTDHALLHVNVEYADEKGKNRDYAIAIIWKFLEQL